MLLLLPLCTAVGVLPAGVVLWLRHIQACWPDPPGSVLLHASWEVQAPSEVDGSGEQAAVRYDCKAVCNREDM
jgi:hypothetical protein